MVVYHDVLGAKERPNAIFVKLMSDVLEGFSGGKVTGDVFELKYNFLPVEYGVRVRPGMNKLFIRDIMKHLLWIFIDRRNRGWNGIMVVGPPGHGKVTAFERLYFA